MRQNAVGAAVFKDARGRGKDVVVDGTFFRVDGADLESGEETFVVLRADSEEQAEAQARQRGLLIASVRPATSEERATAPTSKPTFYSIFSDDQPVTEPVALAEPQAKPAETDSAAIAGHSLPDDEANASITEPPPTARPQASTKPADPAPVVPKGSPSPRPVVAASSRRIPPPPVARRPAIEPLATSADDIAKHPKHASEPAPVTSKPKIHGPTREPARVPVDCAPAASRNATSLIAGAVALGKATPRAEPPPVVKDTPLTAIATESPVAELEPITEPMDAPTVAPPMVVAPIAPPATSTAPSLGMTDLVAAPAPAAAHAALPPRNAPAAGWVATVILSPLGFLSVAGGIAMLVYWMNRPQPAEATDMQKLDGHVQMLMQCFLGGVMLLGGLLLFVAAGLVYVGGGMRRGDRR